MTVSLEIVFSVSLGIVGLASVEGSVVGGWSPLPAHCLTWGSIDLICLIERGGSSRPQGHWEDLACSCRWPGPEGGQVGASWFSALGLGRALPLGSWISGASAAVTGQSLQERPQPGLQPLDSLETLGTIIFC